MPRSPLDAPPPPKGSDRTADEACLAFHVALNGILVANSSATHLSNHYTPCSWTGRRTVMSFTVLLRPPKTQRCARDAGRFWRERFLRNQRYRVCSLMFPPTKVTRISRFKTAAMAAMVAMARPPSAAAQRSTAALLVSDVCADGAVAACCSPSRASSPSCLHAPDTSRAIHSPHTTNVVQHHSAFADCPTFAR